MSIDHAHTRLSTPCAATAEAQAPTRPGSALPTAVPMVDLVAQHAEVQDEIRAGLDDVFASGAFIGGAAVEAFERSYAGFTHVQHCVGVGNGTDALELALRAVGVGPGDEVVAPANTFIATVEAVSRIGAVPVLVDVDPHTLLIDPDQLSGIMGSRTRAIVPVHLFGQTAPVEAVLHHAYRYGAAVVEDAAQSQGATRFGRMSGSLARVAATSFYPGKNLGAAGDAGAVTTNDDGIARMTRLLAAHGSERKYSHEVVGFNSRLDAMQAVVLSAKLSRLQQWNQRRRIAAARYTAALSGVPHLTLPTTMLGNEHVWHQYVVQLPAHRDEVLAMLLERGIGAAIHYPTPVHLTKAFAHLGHGVGDFPVAERAAGQILSLPIHPHLSASQQDLVVETLLAAVERWC